MKLYVARHGQTEYNAQNRICGVTDLPLTEKGLQQAEALAQKLKDKNIDVIIASPLIRAQQTAAAVSGAIGVPVITDSRITEQNYGIYEGKDRGDMGFYANKRQFAVKYPQGESMFQLAGRIYPFLDAIKEKYTDKNVLLVCHGGVCRMIKTYFEDMTNEDYASYSPDNAFVAEYEL